MKEIDDIANVMINGYILDPFTNSTHVLNSTFPDDINYTPKRVISKYYQRITTIYEHTYDKYNVENHPYYNKYYKFVKFDKKIMEFILYPRYMKLLIKLGKDKTTFFVKNEFLFNLKNSLLYSIDQHFHDLVEYMQTGFIKRKDRCLKYTNKKICEYIPLEIVKNQYLSCMYMIFNRRGIQFPREMVLGLLKITRVCENTYIDLRV